MEVSHNYLQEGYAGMTQEGPLGICFSISHILTGGVIIDLFHAAGFSSASVQFPCCVGLVFSASCPLATDRYRNNANCKQIDYY